MIGAEVLNMDYGWYGIACSLLMLELKFTQAWILGWVLTNVVYTIWSGNPDQIAAIATTILMFYARDEDQKPRELEKKFFYYADPIHLAALGALRGLI